MGWKTLKEKFGIMHIVQVAHNQICIGSAYVHNLATIDLQTGKLEENSTFKGFLSREYPLLLKATPEEIRNLLTIPDTFTRSIAVYTYDGSKIIEKWCETPGWPNITHDGSVMYDNTFSTDKALVVAWAKRSASLHIRQTRARIQDVDDDLKKLRDLLAADEAGQVKLDADYPDIHADDAE